MKRWRGWQDGLKKGSWRVDEEERRAGERKGENERKSKKEITEG
jgi:hypothetical protein